MFNSIKYIAGLSLVALFLLSGCARTSTLYSNTFVKPTTRVAKMHVIYIESRLVSRGSNSSEKLYDIGYTDLPELLRERVPIVFGLNKIDSEYATFKNQEFGRAEKIESIKWSNSNPNAMLLTLQIIDGEVVSGSHTARTTTLNMQANLIDPRTKKRQWTGQFRNTFIAPPVGKNGFDNAFVDNLLKAVLEQLAKDEIVSLPNDQVLMPSAQSTQEPVRSASIPAQ